MTEISIKVKFNKGEQIIKEFSILSDMTVEDLRLIIEEEFKVPTYKQNLIYKGNMLQNEKKLEDYKISNNDQILLVEKIGETGDKVGLNKVSGQSGVGVPGQINYDLLKQPMNFSGDINQLVEAMKIPEIAGQMDAILDDPNVMNAMMQNPQIKAMCDMFPNVKDLMMNKEFIKKMMSPENLERLQRLQNGNPNTADLLGGFGLGNNMNNNNLSGLGGLGGLGGGTNPLGSLGMPMGNPFLMNPMFMGGQPNLFGQGLNNNNFNSNFNNNNMTPEQLKEKYKNQIASIKEMGFDKEDDIIKALQKTNGNVDAAIERLCSDLK